MGRKHVFAQPRPKGDLLEDPSILDLDQVVVATATLGWQRECFKCQMILRKS